MFFTAAVRASNWSTETLTDLRAHLPASWQVNETRVTTAGSIAPATQAASPLFSWDLDSVGGLLPNGIFEPTMVTTLTHGAATGLLTATLPYSDTTVDKSFTLYVDTEIPTVTISIPQIGDNLGNGNSYYVVGGTAVDATSWATDVYVSVSDGVTAVVPVDANNLWAYTWPLPTIDGHYTLAAQAVDQFGHLSVVEQVIVAVDHTPPAATLPNSIVPASGNSKQIDVPLSGVATDNVAGVQRIQVSVDGKPYRTVWLTDTNGVLSTTWSTTWAFSSEASSQGEHTLALRAYDRAGNLYEATSTFVVDMLPPSSELVDSRYQSGALPQIMSGQVFTLTGVANEAGHAPKPPSPEPLIPGGTALNSIQDATIWLQPSDIYENDGGVTVHWLGDINGDRLADLGVGLPAADEGRGAIAIVNGRAGDWPVPRLTEAELLDDSRTRFVGAAGANLGDQFVGLNDVNTDGFDDLLIGDPTHNQGFLILGQPTGFGYYRVLEETASEWVRLRPNAGEQWTLVSSAGDVNGDQATDWFVGTVMTQGATITRSLYLMAGGTNIDNYTGQSVSDC